MAASPAAYTQQRLGLRFQVHWILVRLRLIRHLHSSVFVCDICIYIYIYIILGPKILENGGAHLKANLERGFLEPLRFKLAPRCFKMLQIGTKMAQRCPKMSQDGPE
jgi:hypothetical protein